ncbi:MAG: rhodanese-like domain-containing protein [Microbacteriaceae bacterium]|jgi:phage shock protein E|nr:rhodanese-like domain-containing protein [Gemmatimonadaceae bacterium]MCC6855276.1 rhodanese-like domain-containing protein [Microbacteriaceae bacterium]
MARFRNLPVDHVIDVRSKLEFWLGHLPGAVNVPLDTLPNGLEDVDGLTTKSRILVYCASGMRSAQAAALLGRAGYSRVTDGGGISQAKAEFEAA